MSTLLQSCSYAAEKYFKRHNRFDIVIVVTLDQTGRKLFYERNCFGAPKEPSDDEILSDLADELRQDFAAADVIEFAISYLAKRSRQLRNTSTGATETLPASVVLIEHHSATEHLRGCREIIFCVGKPILGALELTGSADGSIYADVLYNPPYLAAEGANT